MDVDFKKLRRCYQNNHNFEEVTKRGKFDTGEEKVIRWCCVCGAIKIDKEVDGKVVEPGMVRYPKALI